MPNWWTPFLVGGLVGLGVACGVLCFLLVSESSVAIYRWIRQRIYRLVKWRKGQRE